jgi:DNA-binding winged helix-turn-helix (wHTH) protein
VPLKLPPRERRVLALFVRRMPGIVPKEDFAAFAWDGDMSDQSLARSASRLRAHLAAAGHHVEAVYGIGYRLVQERAAAGPQPPASRDATHPPSAQVLETCAHCMNLLQQRTPPAVARAIELLRGTLVSSPGFRLARVALADALAVAVGWGQAPTLASVDEGLRVLAGMPAGSEPPGHAAAQAALLDLAWRFDDAERAFEKAMRLEGDRPDVLLAFARHLLCTDRPMLAAKHLRKAVRLAPHRVHLRITLSRALVQAGLGAQALAEAQAAQAEHPGELFVAAFALAMHAMADPRPELEAAACRMSSGLQTPPFVWSVLAFVLARLGRRDDALHIIDAVLLCSATTIGEASLHAAPLAALGETDRAARLLQAAYEDRCGMLAMVLRDPAHAHWLHSHRVGRELLRGVFGGRRADPAGL